MSLIEIILIAIGLAMDAFAVSICKGLKMEEKSWKKPIIIGLYFGIFQGLMPLIGYLLGSSFQEIVENVDHWVAFGLLSVIGINMIKESLSKEEENESSDVDFKTMLPLAIATSIDALAVGITFAFVKTNILVAVILIGIITFAISLIGVKLGKKFGDKLESKAGILGGIILIAIGIKILLEHLGILNFII